MHAESYQGNIGPGQFKTGQTHKDAHAGRKQAGDQNGQYRGHMMFDGKNPGTVGTHHEKGHLAEREYTGKSHHDIPARGHHGPDETHDQNVHDESNVSHKDGQNSHDPVGNADDYRHVL